MVDIQKLDGDEDIWGSGSVEVIEGPIDSQTIAGEPQDGGEENDPPITEEEIVNLEEEELIRSHQTLVAKKLIEDGFIFADESELESLDYDKIYDKLKEGSQEKVKNEILSEVTNELRAVGITEENIFLLNAISNGAPTNEIQVVQTFDNYSKLPDTVEDDIKLRSVKEMLISKGFSDKDIKRQLDQIELEESIDEDFKVAKEYFKNVVVNYESQQAEIMAKRLEEENSVRQANQLILDKALREGVLGEDKLTPAQQKELSGLIYNKNIPVDLGDGKPVLLSDFEKFLYDVNNNFKKQLEFYTSIKWKSSQIEKAKAEAVKSDKTGHWEALKKVQKTDKTSGSIMRSLIEEGFGEGAKTFEFRNT